MNDIAKIFLGFGLLFVFLMGIGYILSINFESNLEAKCNKYKNEYNIMTILVGNRYHWDNTLECYVLMEDGTKIEIQDFEIAGVKVPISTQKRTKQ